MKVIRLASIAVLFTAAMASVLGGFLLVTTNGNGPEFSALRFQGGMLSIMLLFPALLFGWGAVLSTDPNPNPDTDMK